MLLVDVFKGRVGLGETFWVWFFVGNGVANLLFIAATYAAAHSVDPLVAKAAEYGCTTFRVMWALFTSIGVVNAARNREPSMGRLGVAACGFVALYIMGMGTLVAKVTGTLPHSWFEMEIGLQAQNKALPLRLDDETTLTRIEARPSDRTVVFHIDIDYAAVTPDPAMYDEGRSAILEECASLREMLRTAERVVFMFKARDGRTVEIDIRREDCGV